MNALMRMLAANKSKIEAASKAATEELKVEEAPTLNGHAPAEAKGATSPLQSMLANKLAKAEEAAQAPVAMTLAEKLAAKKQAPAAAAPTEAPIEASDKGLPLSKKLTLAEKLALRKKEGAQAPVTTTEAAIKAAELRSKMEHREAIHAAHEAAEVAESDAEAAMWSLTAEVLDAIGETDEPVKTLNEAPPVEEPVTPAKAMSLIEKLRANKNKTTTVGELLGKKIPTEAPKPLHVKATEIVVEDSPIKGAPQVRANEVDTSEMVGANRAAVSLNEEQLRATRIFVDEHRSCVMIGPAGTGKTTGVRGVAKRLLDEGKLAFTANFKRQGGTSTKDRVENQPRIAFVSFTRRAAGNIRDSIISQEGLEVFEWCAQTIHNLLEYCPVYYEQWDDEAQEYKKTMRFEPQRTATNKVDIDYLVIEEASMVDLDLFSKLLEALPLHCRILFLGDINQLPPVFGLPILAYAMLKLEVVELVQVYRQAMGPILRNAHNILAGLPLVCEEEEHQSFLIYEEYKAADGRVGLQKQGANKGSPIMLGESALAKKYISMFESFHRAGRYDPEKDIILTPFNVGDLGSKAMNQGIAQFFGSSRKAVVWHIIAGFNQLYLAVGDKVMVDKQDGVITNIAINHDYMGATPKHPGVDLTRYGVRIIGQGEAIDLDEEGHSFDLDAMMEKTAEEMKRAASHCVEILLETGETVVLSSAGEFADSRFSLGYCLTGHKSQGSEWRNVYIIMHKKHHSLISREWLYTAVTRAKKTCTLLARDYSIAQALGRQRITGDTLEEKIAWFTSGAVDNIDDVQVTPQAA